MRQGKFVGRLDDAGPQSGSAFVNAPDAPLPSVVSFQVDIIGPLTGVVDPMLKLKAITPTDSDAYLIWMPLWQGW